MVSPEPEDCITQPFTQVTAGEGYLASVTTETTGCGSNDSPWLVKTESGQTIKLTLLDFAVSHMVYNQGMPSTCLVYVTIKDP